jgi:hypothetical protein
VPRTDAVIILLGASRLRTNLRALCALQVGFALWAGFLGFGVVVTG